MNCSFTDPGGISPSFLEESQDWEGGGRPYLKCLPLLHRNFSFLIVFNSTFNRYSQNLLTNQILNTMLRIWLVNKFWEYLLNIYIYIYIYIYIDISNILFILFSLLGSMWYYLKILYIELLNCIFLGVMFSNVSIMFVCFSY